jgi:hypothetical protein
MFSVFSLHVLPGGIIPVMRHAYFLRKNGARKSVLSNMDVNSTECRQNVIAAVSLWRAGREYCDKKSIKQRIRAFFFVSLPVIMNSSPLKSGTGRIGKLLAEYALPAMFRQFSVFNKEAG